MSLKALPILVLNLAGEMSYILEQRLNYQKVRRERTRRVMSEIVSAAFGGLFLEKLFEPQELPSRDTMKLLIEKLVHSSIIRLTSNSLDKLYDLVLMMFKYQLQNTISPRHILVITMNHLDGIRRVVQDCKTNLIQIDNAYNLIRLTYFGMNMTELYYIRQTLLNFFLDTRVRVCLLLQERLQRDDGRFTVPLKVELPPRICKPGVIRFYGAGGKVISQHSFDAGGFYIEKTTDEVLDFPQIGQIDRGSDLGNNIYEERQSGQRVGTNLFSFRKMSRRECLAKEELSLLKHLIVNEDHQNDGTFTLNLFDDSEENAPIGEENKLPIPSESLIPTVNDIIHIDASRPNQETLRLLKSLEISHDESNTPKSHSEMLLNMFDEGT